MNEGLTASALKQEWGFSFLKTMPTTKTLFEIINRKSTHSLAEEGAIMVKLNTSSIAWSCERKIIIDRSHTRWEEPENIFLVCIFYFWESNLKVSPFQGGWCVNPFSKDAIYNPEFLVREMSLSITEEAILEYDIMEKRVPFGQKTSGWGMISSLYSRSTQDLHNTSHKDSLPTVE